jgi:hypothetical protein
MTPQEQKVVDLFQTSFLDEGPAILPNTAAALVNAEVRQAILDMYERFPAEEPYLVEDEFYEERLCTDTGEFYLDWDESPLSDTGAVEKCAQPEQVLFEADKLQFSKNL